MSNDYLIKKRIRLAKVMSTLIFGVPFVRCVILNGSLAQGKSERKSDIDLLIICKSGRIFTARFLSTLLVWLTGFKRSSNESKYHGGKICLNYFLTDQFLIIPHNRGEEMDRYCAKNYSQSLLMAGDRMIFKKFVETNHSWMQKYVANQKIKADPKIMMVSSNQPKAKFVFEKLLSGYFGHRIEMWFKRLQINRINNDPRTKKYPHLIVVNDNEMRFHPPKKSDAKVRGLDLERKQ